MKIPINHVSVELSINNLHHRAFPIVRTWRHWNRKDYPGIEKAHYKNDHDFNALRLKRGLLLLELLSVKFTREA